MRRVLASLLLLAPWVAAQTGTMEGTVTDRVTGAGIGGVSITLFTRKAVRYQATSSPTGRFQVTGMQPGTYEARYEKDGFTAFRGDPRQVTLGDGDAARISLEMTRLVALRGRVVDANGDPVAGIEVQVRPGTPVTTGGRGEFAYEKADPGSYAILAVPPDPPPAADGEERVVPVPTYYDGGRRVLVRGDADVTGLEIRLESAPVYRVSGTVVDQTGAPQPGADVQLFAVDRSGPAEVFRQEARTQSGDDGSFEFAAVRPGDWRVAATGTGNIDSPDFIRTIRTGSEAVSVGRSDVDRVSVRLAGPFTLTGTSDWDGAAPQQVRILLRPADGRSAAFMPTLVQALSVNRTAAPKPMPPPAAGSIRLDEISPGKYIVAPDAPPGFYVSAVLLGGTDITDQAVDLLPGSPPLRVLFKRTQGAIRGQVANGAAASVLVVHKGARGLDRAVFVPCQPDGSFGPLNVPPGNYFIAAFDRMDQRLQSDPALLEYLSSRGTAVTVTPTGPVSVELRATRWPE